MNTRFSEFELHIIAILQRIAGNSFAMSDLMDEIGEPRRAKNAKFWRQSVMCAFRRLQAKLGINGVQIKRISPLGRGAKAVYHVDEMILKISAFPKSDYGAKSRAKREMVK